MSTWTVPLNAVPPAWKLRVLSGTSIGKEFELPLSRYVLGSQAPANIVIPDPSIAPQHVVIDLQPHFVRVTDCSSGRSMAVNGRSVAAAQLAPGDQVTVGTFSFEFSNPGLAARTPSTRQHPWVARFLAWPLYARVGTVSGAVAITLYLFLQFTLTPTLVPVTLLALSAVVPATLICYLVERYDKTGMSFKTLAITFVAGATVGIIVAMFNFTVVNKLLGGLLLASAVFAGFAEEPAKLLGTAWRWRHPRYDHPMDGLILGTVSGLGFAVAETAGYGFNDLMEHNSLSHMFGVLFFRSIASPFTHGLWSGILAAAFWQCNRDFSRAFRSKMFGIAAAWAVGMHALWNSQAMLPKIGWPLMIASASLSVWQYRLLLARNGYRQV